MFAFETKRAVSIAALVAALSIAPPLTAQEAGEQARIDRFGVGIRYPADLIVDEDRHLGQRMELSLIREGADGPDIRMGVRVITPQIAQSLAAQPGEDGFAALLSQVVGVTFEDTGVTVQIGGVDFMSYAGTGTRTAGDGTEVGERALFLVSELPLPSGDGLWLAVYSTGLGAEAALLEADFVAGLTLDPAIAGSLAPITVLGGLVSVAQEAGREVNLRRNPRRVMVQGRDAGTDDPDILLTAELLRDPGERVTRMAEMRLFQVDAITQGMRGTVPVWVIEGSGHPLVTGDRAEDGVGQPTRLEISSLCAPGEGPVVLGATVPEGSVDPSLLDAMRLDLPDEVISCGTPLNMAIGTMVERYEPSVIQGVDIAEETTDVAQVDEPAQEPDVTAEVAPAQAPGAVPTEDDLGTPEIVMEVAPEDVPAGAPEPTAEVAQDDLPEAPPAGMPGATPDEAPQAADGTMPVVVPEAAPEVAEIETPEESPDVQPSETPSELPAEPPAETPEVALDETPDASPEAPTAEPVVPEVAALLPLPQPDGTVPPGWATHERFGIRIAAPADAEIESDMSGAQRMEFLVERTDDAAGTVFSAGVMVASAATAAQMPAPGTDAFVAMLADWANMDVEQLDGSVALGGQDFHAYSAAGQRSAGDEETGRVLYLVAAAPLDNGNRPFAVIAALGHDDAQAITLIHDTVRSLAVPDTADWGRVTMVGLLDGLGTYRIPPGLVPVSVEGTDMETTIALSPVGDEAAHSMVVVERLRRAPDAWIANRLTRIDALSAVSLGDIAGWALDGPSPMRPDFNLAGPDEGIAARYVLLGRCLADGTPLAVGTITMDGGLAADLVAGAMLNLPADAVDCPEVIDPIRAAMAEAEVTNPDAAVPLASPPADAVQPVDPVPLVQPPSGVLITPGTGGSKDPTPPPSPDPEAESWAAAEAAQNPEAMIGYLNAHPAGPNAEAARAWLMARAIMPPGAQPTPPQVATPPGGSEISPPPGDDEFAYAQALSSGTAQALIDFLKAFPSGRFAEMAVVDLMRMGVDARAFFQPGGAPAPARTPAVEPAPAQGQSSSRAPAPTPVAPPTPMPGPGK